MLNADTDWIEGFRRFWYPKIHGILSRIGETIGIPLYARGVIRTHEPAGYIEESEEIIEKKIESISGERNPIAALKNLPNGRVSEGSWVFLHEDYPEIIEEDMQLHITLFETNRIGYERVIYTHYEDNWRTSPIAHLQAKNFNRKAGVRKTLEILRNDTELSIKHRNNA